MTRFLLSLLCLALLTMPAWAEDRGHPWVYVLRASDGKVLERFKSVGYSDPDPADLKRMPILARVVKEQFTGFNRARDEARVPGQPDAVMYHKLPGGSVLALLVEQKTAEGWVQKGRFAVVSPKGRLLFELPYVFKDMSAGGSLRFEPRIAVWKQLAVVEDRGTLTAYSLATGKKSWTSRLSLGEVGYDKGGGVWGDGRSLYVWTSKGLSRVEPSTGQVLWSTSRDLPDVAGDMLIGSDGRLYFVGYGAPIAVTDALRKVAKARYRGQEMGLIIVPYQDGYFASTPLYAGEKWKKRAVWEYRSGRWSWIFDYGPSLSDGQVSAIYARNGFSPKMRKRLEGDDI